MFAFNKQVEESAERKEERKQQLKERQTKLKEILLNEKIKHEEELKSLRTNGKDNINNIYSMKTRVENLRSAREEERKKLAEEKLYENWRLNNPELREIESKKHQEYLVEKWQDQLEQKREAKLELEKEENEYVKYLELEKQKAADLDLELKRLKLNREIELKEILKQQMIELKQREAESEILNREEADLMQEKIDTVRMHEERERIKEKNQRQEYGRQLLRQHKAKLRKMAKDIREELELDLRILQTIKETQDKQKHLESAKRVKAKADAERMLEVLNEQLRLEKQREIELEAMFQDEAAKEWDKRVQQWDRESGARQMLMKQVLEERQQQIDEKFTILEEKKNESLLKREELIKDMERTQQMAMKEREKMEKAKLERKVDLDQQLTTRQERLFKDDVLKEVESFEKEQMEKEAYSKFLEQETKKQIEQKFEPKVRLLF